MYKPKAAPPATNDTIPAAIVDQSAHSTNATHPSATRIKIAKKIIVVFVMVLVF